MRSFKNLDISIQAAIITFAITLIGFLATLFLFFIGMMDVPLGILLGGFVCGSLSLLTYFFGKKDDYKQSVVYSIISIIIRFVLLIALVIIIAFMNYQWGLTIFNIFSFVGMYTASTIVLAILYSINK